MRRSLVFVAILLLGLSTSPCEAAPGKVLVVFGSKAGSTAEVAQAIGKSMASDQTTVDVLPAAQADHLDGYDAVVIGSAIRAGSVLGEVRGFVSRNRDALKRRQVAYFVVCMTMKEDTPENRKKADGYLDPLRKQVAPVDCGLFAGKMDRSKLGFIARTMVSGPDGDFRNWKAIDAWAKDLRVKMKLP